MHTSGRQVILKTKIKSIVNFPPCHIHYLILYLNVICTRQMCAFEESTAESKFEYWYLLSLCHVSLKIMYIIRNLCVFISCLHTLYMKAC